MKSCVYASQISLEPTLLKFNLVQTKFIHIGQEYLFDVHGLNCSGIIRKLGDSIKLTGSYSGTWQKQCDKCLELSKRTSKGGFDIVLVYREKSLLDDSNLNQEVSLNEVELDYYDNDRIELGPYFESQFILDSDAIFICSDHCLGLCAVCGNNKNTNQCNCEDAIANKPFAVLKSLT